MVLDIMYAPLNENFEILPQGMNMPLEQWYYANDNTYVPERNVAAPLILVPTLQVQDIDTSMVSTPVMYTAQWFLLNSSTGAYDIEITSTTAQNDGYYLSTTGGVKDGKLIVTKNVPYDAAVSILCKYTYIDTRDSTQTHEIEGTVSLATNRDATVTMPTIVIAMTEDGTKYNPITDDTDSQFTFKAQVLKDGEDITTDSTIRWYASENGGAETLIDELASDGFKKFLCYVSGQGTDTLVVDAMYTENITIIARVVKDATTTPITLYPTKDFTTLQWDVVNLDAITTSRNGSAVRSDTESMEFYNIINVRHNEVSDALKQKHLRVNWKRRVKSGVSDVDMGWGQSITISSNTLKSSSSTRVFSEIYLRGAYERITHNGTTITHNNELVVYRSIN